MTELPITASTWTRLKQANFAAVSIGWAETGVFATGIGPEYQPGAQSSLLYVGKSAGPLGTQVESGLDQAASSRASTEWMIQRRNRSAFWQFVDQIDPSRRTLSWTNICKFDRKGGERPPSPRHWASVSGVCMAALEEEVRFLEPKVIVFATSDYSQNEVSRLLDRLDFSTQNIDFSDGWTKVHKNRSGAWVIETKHPQGWIRSDRDRVVLVVRQLLANGTLS